MPESWRKIKLVPFYKRRGDIRSCPNYKSVKHLKNRIKVIEKIFEE